VERFRRREILSAAQSLQDWALEWGERVLDKLAAARPVIPQELPDRAGDSWEPLLAISDLAGGDWSERARTAAIELSGEAAEADASIGVRLLADCRAVFNGQEHLATKDLIASLAEDEEAPWGGWHKGFPISPRSLANRSSRSESDRARFASPATRQREGMPARRSRIPGIATPAPIPPISPTQRHKPHRNRD
jgi:Protein of unknown function (DUF3631)